MLIVMKFMGRVHAVDDLLRLRVPCEGVSCRLGLLKEKLNVYVRAGPLM
jgi:hypothetical protein